MALPHMLAFVFRVRMTFACIPPYLVPYHQPKQHSACLQVKYASIPSSSKKLYQMKNRLLHPKITCRSYHQKNMQVEKLMIIL
ncbi:hypothetical protein QL285_041937 [Trifolium repens]|nr:hypothetical protein QL285_041937 [Trifolium repens]